MDCRKRILYIIIGIFPFLSLVMEMRLTRDILEISQSELLSILP